MSLSIFDDDELVEALGYSREFSLPAMVNGFSVHAQRSSEEDRANFARWYARTKADAQRWAAYLARQRAEKRAAYIRKREAEGKMYTPRGVIRAVEKCYVDTPERAAKKRWRLTKAEVAAILSSSEPGVVLAAKYGVSDKTIWYHRNAAAVLAARRAAHARKRAA